MPDENPLHSCRSLYTNGASRRASYPIFGKMSLAWVGLKDMATWFDVVRSAHRLPYANSNMSVIMYFLHNPHSYALASPQYTGPYVTRVWLYNHASGVLLGNVGDLDSRPRGSLRS